jgi:hypothetical protein
MARPHPYLGERFVFSLTKGDRKDLISIHSEIMNVKLLVSNSETRIFLSWQRNQGIALLSDRRSPPQTILQIDTARAKKDRFRMETN